MRGDGKYISARFRHYGNVIISPLNQTQDSDKIKKAMIPGPGTYK